jgi:hypothetical protein
MPGPGLTPKKHAQRQAAADATGELFFNVVGTVAYQVNIIVSAAEEAHLINSAYVGTDSEMRDFAAAIAAHHARN